MNDYLWIAIAVVFVAFLMLKRQGRISVAEARAYRRSGAVILDVRSAQERASASVAGSVNIPLNGVVQGVRKAYPDPATVLLCHCASGARSAAAVKQLKAAGYANAHNLGGIARAGEVAS